MTMECQAVVMAAGRGSRMLDLTADSKKYLSPLGNKPMLWHCLHYLEISGFQEAIVISNDSKMEIYKAMEGELGINIDVVTLPPSVDWGTADSLRHIKDKIRSDVLVISSDLVINFPLYKLLDVYRVHGASLVALYSPIPDAMKEMSIPGPNSKKKYEKDYVGIEKNTQRLIFLSSEADYEESIPFKKSILRKHPEIQYRSDLLDAHLYIIKKWVIDYLALDQNISMIKGELVPLLVKKQFKSQTIINSENIDESICSLKVNEVEKIAQESEDSWKVREMSTWHDHGGDIDSVYHRDNIRCYGIVMEDGFCMRSNTLPTFLELNKQMVSNWSSFLSCKDQPPIPSSVEAKTKIQGCSSSSIGDCSKLGDKISVKCSAIGKHCKIGDKVKILNSVILNHVKIEDGCTIQNSIICNNVSIGVNSELKDCIVGSGQSVESSSKHTHEAIVDSDRLMEI